MKVTLTLLQLDSGLEPHQCFSRCYTRGESEDSILQATKHTSEGIHPGFETQIRLHKKSKPWISVAELWSKVMFLHMSFCPWGKGDVAMSIPVMDSTTPWTVPPFMASPRQQHPLDSTTPAH